nr:reverse transcriptase domain-containing protein [Tanacetum cinerariifolium]
MPNKLDDIICGFNNKKIVDEPGVNMNDVDRAQTKILREFMNEENGEDEMSVKGKLDEPIMQENGSNHCKDPMNCQIHEDEVIDEQILSLATVTANNDADRSFLRNLLKLMVMEMNLWMWGRKGFKDVVDVTSGVFFMKLCREEGMESVVNSGPWMAPTEGYEDAIVVPSITADNFELKHGLLTLVQNKQFFGHDKEDPHAHICHFNKITSTLKFPKVSNTSIKLMLFPFSLKELHQLDVFYNALNSKDQDSLNFAAGGNFVDKMPRDCLAIIESKSKVRYLCDKPIVAKVSMNASTFGVSPDVVELKDMVKALLLDKKGQNQSHAPVKAVDESCVTYGGAHSYRNCPATDGNVYRDNIQELVSQASAVNYNQGNTSYRPQMMSNQIRPLGFPPAPAYQALAPQTQGVLKEDFSAYVKANDLVMKNMQTQGQNMQNQLTNLTNLITKFVNSNSASTLSLGTLPSNTITNPKSDLKAITTRSGDPGMFLIPCDFPSMAECLALADLGGSINLMPFSIWKRLSLPDLTLMCMTLELADRSISHPVRVAEDVYVKVGSFHFSANFVVVDFDADPRVPLILRRSFLKTRRALIDLFEGELTLRFGKEAITFNLDQTSKYSANYSDMMAKQIDVIDMACEEYSQEVLGFFDTISSGNPTLFYDPIVFATSSTLTPFENKAFLNDDPSLPHLNQRNYLPEVRKELKICEAKSNKSSVDEHPVVELKALPPFLEYAFLEGDDKLPVIFAKDLSVEEKTALITVLKSYKRAIAWNISDIKGINPEFSTYKILIEEDFTPAVQYQRRVNPKIDDVIKQEVIKLLNTGLIYPISDSPWVSLVRCVPKKGWFTVVENEDKELIPTRLVMGWLVCIDYRKLNEATRKDDFPLPFMDQMQERSSGNQYYYFLYGFFGYFQIPIDPKDQEKTTFICPYRTFAYRRMPFDLCNAPGKFQRFTIQRRGLIMKRVVLYIPSEITKEIPMEVEAFEPPQDEEAPVHRSERPHRAPDYLCLNVEGEAAFILGIKIYRDRLRRLIGRCQSAYMDKILKRYRMDNSKRGYIPMLERLDLNNKQGMEAVWIRKFISGHGIVPIINELIKMFCDNSAALHFANKPGFRGAPDTTIGNIIMFASVLNWAK